MLDWRLISILGCVAAVAIVCGTILTLHGKVDGTTMGVAVIGVVTAFGAWLSRPPVITPKSESVTLTKTEASPPTEPK